MDQLVAKGVLADYESEGLRPLIDVLDGALGQLKDRTDMLADMQLAHAQRDAAAVRMEVRPLVPQALSRNALKDVVHRIQMVVEDPRMDYGLSLVGYSYVRVLKHIIARYQVPPVKLFRDVRRMLTDPFKLTDSINAAHCPHHLCSALWAILPTPKPLHWP